jgi:anthranilate phosphoribosyltransferase
MPNAKVPIRTPVKRVRTDLSSLYRPIGIGAVAAALTVKGEQQSEPDQPAEAQHERYDLIESLAA